MNTRYKTRYLFKTKKSLFSSHTLTSPSPKPKTHHFLPPKSKPKAQILPLSPPPPWIAATTNHHHCIFWFSSLYYVTHSLSIIIFNWKSNSIPQSLGTLAFLFFFSLNLSFSIETKQRKGSLLNDANKGNVSLSLSLSLSLILFYFLNLEIWFRLWYCGRIGFDLGRTGVWHWFVKPLLFLIRVILGRVPMVVFLWLFKFLSLNYLTDLPSLAHIFVSRWPMVLYSSILSCLFWILNCYSSFLH